jgi:hypothetical protein
MYVIINLPSSSSKSPTWSIRVEEVGVVCLSGCLAALSYLRFTGFNLTYLLGTYGAFFRFLDDDEVESWLWLHACHGIEYDMI